MAGHTDAVRDECRRAYAAGEKLLPLSQRTGIDRKTLRNWAIRDGWDSPPTSPLGRDTTAVVRARVIDIATRQAVDSGLVEKIAEAVELDFTQDVAMSGMLMRASRQTLQDFLDGKIEPGPMQNKADVLKSVVAANKSVFELRRQMAGKRSGDASIDLGPRVDPKINVSIQRLPSTKTEYEARKIA